jgi:hypothetical protein
MQFGEMIEAGAKKFDGNSTELARQLGQDSAVIRAAKAGKRGLPDDVCVKLAEIIGEEWPVVVAAKNEWTAKTEAEKKLWSRLSRRVSALAATVIGVTLFVTTPSEAIAAQGNSGGQNAGIHIITTWMRRLRGWAARTADLVHSSYAAWTKPIHSVDS